MSNFVIRPRINSAQTYFQTNSTNDFVAEIRPHRLSQSECMLRNNQCNVEAFSDEDLRVILSGGHFSIESITRLLRGSILTFVEKLLTGRSLSRVEGRLCVTLSSHESPLIINFDQTYSSNSNRFRLNEESLEDSFNVKVRNDFLGTCPRNGGSFEALSPSFEFEREHCNSVAEADDRANLKAEYHRNSETMTPSPTYRNNDRLTQSSTHENGDSLTQRPTHRNCDSLTANPIHSFQFTTTDATAPETESFAESHTQCSPPEPKFENHHESDDESGYTSNEKEDSDSSSDHCECSSNRTCYHKLFNEYYCSGFDDKNTLYTPEDYGDPVTKSGECGEYLTQTSRDGTYDLDDEDEEDFECDHRLVIDETSAPEMGGKSTNTICSSKTNLYKESDHLMDVDLEERSSVSEMNRDGVQSVFLYKERGETCLYVGTENEDFLNSSDITDTDVPFDFPGDSKLTLDVMSGTSQSQSLVSKHHDGFRCVRCARILEDIAAVAAHFQTEHDLHCCTVCCRTFTAKNNLKRHIRIHTGQRPYKCTQCTQSFSRRDDLKDHQLRHEYTNPFRCSVCKRGYTDRARVKNHMAKEHGSCLIHVCPQCGESYDQEEAFAAHKRTHPELQQFSCETCSFIGINSQMIQKHLLLHTHKLFSCKPCNAYFADPFDYTDHIRKHKKISSFSKYVCCFCDMVLSTYNQYIRHEHSHVQGKTHFCKTCKKLFKSKSLLQEHVTVHQNSEFIKAETLHRSPTESPEFSESNSMYWQSNEAQTSVVYSQNTKSEFQAENISLSSPPPLETGSSHEEENYDEFEGQLLDLSIKKIQTSDPNHPRDEKYFDRCLREIGFPEKNFPRNGVVLSSPCIFEKVHGDSQHPFRTYPTMKAEVRHEERLTSLEDNTDSSMNCEWDSITSDAGSTSPNLSTAASRTTRSYLKPLLNARLRCDERRVDTEYSPPVKLGRRLLDHNNTCVEHAQRSSFRFSPYSREKFADLAAKFVAARGTQIFQQNVSLRTNTPNWENRQEAAVLRGMCNQLDQASKMASPNSKLTCNFESGGGFNYNQTLPRILPPNKENIATMTNLQHGDEIMCEESNPETALRYHAPTLVKSEPIFEKGRDTEDVVKGRSQSFRDDCTKSKNGCTINLSNNCRSTSFGCEECKDMFGSFSELENHSVEVHKRFLCEHCRKSFTARPNRDRHVRYHTGERPYKCDLCDLAFFRGDDLKYHRTTRHHTAQPFICTYCNANFSWKRDLDRHIRHSKCKT